MMKNMMKKNRIKRYLAIALCAVGLVSWSAEGKIEQLQAKNKILKEQVQQLTKQVNGTLSSFTWGLFGGLTSSYKPFIGRAISATGLAYYRSLCHLATIGIGHILGHLLAQTYRSNSNNKTQQKLTYI